MNLLIALSLPTEIRTPQIMGLFAGHPFLSFTEGRRMTSGRPSLQHGADVISATRHTALTVFYTWSRQA